ncbi:MAG: kinase [Proteobacteria bacterium]|nr:kinase [Pseudomonadota bacterium]
MPESLEDFMAREGLPDSFRKTADLVCEPLAARAHRRRIDRKRCAVIGLCGAQGSGKSTVAAWTVQLLEERGLRAVALSLDDFYLTHEARQRLAKEVHPLLATRGPPGTHDVGMASAALDALRTRGKASVPKFDKASDTRAPRAQWPTVATPVDVIILEGWCVGAIAQGRAALATPVNALERDEDPDGVWRGYVNDQLDGPYQDLFGKLHDLVLLAAPSFEVVAKWRGEQEEKLRAKGKGGMSDAEIARFVAHYERLTRWILAEMPGRAAWTVTLDTERNPFG